MQKREVQDGNSEDPFAPLGVIRSAGVVGFGAGLVLEICAYGFAAVLLFSMSEVRGGALVFCAMFVFAAGLATASLVMLIRWMDYRRRIQLAFSLILFGCSLAPLVILGVIVILVGTPRWL
ncbi:MAG: hypothetical protein ACYTAF_02505 [Planctomycetota bacterium]|jgi:hypothetical protein